MSIESNDWAVLELHMFNMNNEVIWGANVKKSVLHRFCIDLLSQYWLTSPCCATFESQLLNMQWTLRWVQVSADSFAEWPGDPPPSKWLIFLFNLDLRNRECPPRWEWSLKSLNCIAIHRQEIPKTCPWPFQKKFFLLSYFSKYGSVMCALHCTPEKVSNMCTAEGFIGGS